MRWAVTSVAKDTAATTRSITPAEGQPEEARPPSPSRASADHRRPRAKGQRPSPASSRRRRGRTRPSPRAARPRTAPPGRRPPTPERSRSLQPQAPARRRASLARPRLRGLEAKRGAAPTARALVAGPAAGRIRRPRPRGPPRGRPRAARWVSAAVSSQARSSASPGALVLDAKGVLRRSSRSRSTLSSCPDGGALLPVHSAGVLAVGQLAQAQQVARRRRGGADCPSSPTCTPALEWGGSQVKPRRGQTSSRSSRATVRDFSKSPKGK